MKFAIHGQDTQGGTDVFFIEDDDIEACKVLALDGVIKRQWIKTWSERL